MTDTAAPPPDDSVKNVDAALALVRERHAWARENTVAAFEMLTERLAAAPDMPQVLATLRRELHRVHGTAWGAGSGEASRLATAMETLASRWMDDPGLDRDRRSAVVAQFARSLGEALANADASAADDLRGASKRLLLIELLDDVAAGLVAEGVARGYRVERLSRAAIAATLRHETPTLIVASEQALAPGEAAGVPRVLLHSSEGVERPSAVAPGQRVLDPRTEAREILDVLELLEQLSGPAAGKVCVVDDDPVVLALLRALVMRDGLEVATFSSASSLLDVLQETNPLILVLDVDLRETTGVELARRVRSEAAWSDVPILMLTAHADVITRTAAFAAGADDYMVKPIVPTEFQRRINRLVEARRRQRLASGVHPATGLPLGVRTMREIEARLRGAGRTPLSVFVVRPYPVPASSMAVTAWMLECVRLARGVQVAGGIAGFVDDVGLGGALPLRPVDVSELLLALVGEAPKEAAPWHAGITGIDPDAPMTPRTLLDAAESACLSARDSAVSVRVWDPGAFDVAPDVVVVESDDALAEMLAFALEARGMTFRRFRTGPSALDALLLMRPHGRTPIVMVEVDLPGLDGHSLHERLRVERPDMFDVVFLSVHASETEQLRAFQGGALDYVTKPFSLRVLMAKLTSWQSRRRRA